MGNKTRSSIPTIFTKKVDTFSEAMEELAKIELVKKILDDSIIQNYFNNHQDADKDEYTESDLEIESFYKELTIARAEEIALNMISLHIPDIEEKNNDFWQINMASTRCYIKTDLNIGFGWDIEITKKSNKVDIASVTVKVVLYNQMKTIDTFNYLAKNGWDIGP